MTNYVCLCFEKLKKNVKDDTNCQINRLFYYLQTRSSNIFQIDQIKITIIHVRCRRDAKLYRPANKRNFRLFSTSDNIVATIGDCFNQSARHVRVSTG